MKAQRTRLRAWLVPKTLLLIVALLLVYPVLLIAQNQNSTAGDRQALVDLFNATSGRNWNNNGGWLNGDPSSSWYGITVNSSGRVTRINLSANNLSGSLPASIGNLTQLEYINLKQNHLTGEIPSSIGNWRKIITLYFSGKDAEDLNPNPNRAYHPGKSDQSGNTFSGEFPNVWSSFTSLKYFQLSGSNITKLLYDSIGDAKELLYLVASWNTKLTDTIPASINQCTKLQWILFRANAMRGTIPSMSNLRDLRHLHLGNGNAFTGNLPDFSQNTMLRSITLDEQRLNGGGLTGEWPHYWNNGKFTNLISLRATFNYFTGTLNGFENLNLKTFSIDGNNLEGTIPESVTSNTELINVGFGWNKFTGQIPQHGWGNHYETRYIRFEGNELTGPIPDELPSSPDLQYLYFNDNHLSGSISTSLGKYANSSKYPVFHYIDISNNAFSLLDYQSLLGILGSSKFRVGGQNPSDSGGGPGGNDSPPETPSLNSPGNVAGDQPTTLTLDWNSSNSADDYQLQVAASSNFSSTVFDKGGITTTSQEVSGLDNSQVYYWRVKAFNQYGASAWSATRSFTTVAQPVNVLPAPVQLSPSDNAQDISLTPTLKWEAVEGADYYVVNLDRPNNGPGLIIDTQVNGTQYTLTKELEPQFTHKWHVRAVKDGVEGEWAPVWAFTTKESDGGGTSSSSTTIYYDEGWNLVSLPRNATDRKFDNIFTDIAPSSIYSYDGTYTPDSELEPGKGYWIKLLSPQQVVFKGTAISSLDLSLKEGWNLIGTTLPSIDVKSEISDPQNIIEEICSPVGDVASGESCVAVTSLEPGKAYFIKASSSGDISLN